MSKEREETDQKNEEVFKEAAKSVLLDNGEIDIKFPDFQSFIEARAKTYNYNLILDCQDSCDKLNDRILKFIGGYILSKYDIIFSIEGNKFRNYLNKMVFLREPGESDEAYRSRFSFIENELYQYHIIDENEREYVLSHRLLESKFKDRDIKSTDA